MYLLKKCGQKNCKRYGSVALTQNSKFCNLHSKDEQNEEGQEEENSSQETKINEPRLTDKDNPTIE